MPQFDQDTLDSLISDYIEFKNVAHFAFLISDYATTPSTTGVLLN